MSRQNRFNRSRSRSVRGRKSTRRSRTRSRSMGLSMTRKPRRVRFGAGKRRLHKYVAKSGLITASSFNLSKKKTNQIRELEYNGTPNVYTTQSFGNYYAAGGQQRIFSYANMNSSDLFFIRSLTPAGSSGNETGARGF